MKVLFILISVCSFLFDQGVSNAGSDVVQMLVKKGDSVTLHTDVKINHQDRIIWYFNATRIAQINGVQKICTDVQCKERFRDRLKLDHQNGSLIITNTTTTDSGDYALLIGGSSSAKTFTVIVIDVSVDKDEVKLVTEGEHVILNTGITEHEIVRWYFNDILIALIDGGPTTSCVYDGEGGRFRDRLKTHYKSGSLIIKNIRPEHTGSYEAEIISKRLGKIESFNRNKQCNSTKSSTKNSTKSSNSDDTIETFLLTVRASKADKNEEEPQKAPQDQNIDTSSDLSSAAVAGIVVVVVLLVVIAVVGVMIYCRRSSRNYMKTNNHGLL